MKTRTKMGIMGAVGLILLFTSTALAGWRIDGPRFMESVHGEMGCADCHSDISFPDHHPAAGNVTKKLGDFFTAEKCLECHDDVQGQIEDDAEHGGQKVDDAQRFFNCIGCHDPHYQGAPEKAEAGAAGFSEEDQACMTCHQALAPGDPEAAAKNRQFCFSCHEAREDMPTSVPVMNAAEYEKTVHAKLDCMTCHPGADRYEHHAQPAGDCTQCHHRHEESVTHEAHAGVSCQACHLDSVVPVRDRLTNEVVWERSTPPGKVSTLHNLIKPDGEGCARCHFEGTTVGAAAMILPAKSVMCMPCHTATLTAADTTSIVSLLIFGLGMLGFISLWFSGSFAANTGSGIVGNLVKAVGSALGAIFSSKFKDIAVTLWFDVFLQRRLYRRSPERWTIHALIFWPFVIRFFWGILALVLTNFAKSMPLAWALVDKNHPATALVFDITGVCLIVGIVLAFVRGTEADKTRTPGLPDQDRLALILIGGIALVGFILEGMRIALTGAQEPACWALVGYGISKLFSGMSGLSELYGYVWYLHAILTGLFVAYLPFSKMMHIIMSPLALAMAAANKKHH